MLFGAVVYFQIVEYYGSSQHIYIARTHIYKRSLPLALSFSSSSFLHQRSVARFDVCMFFSHIKKIKMCYLSRKWMKMTPHLKMFAQNNNNNSKKSTRYSPINIQFAYRNNNNDTKQTQQQRTEKKMKRKKIDLKSQWNHKKSFLGVCSLQTMCEGSISMAIQQRWLNLWPALMVYQRPMLPHNMKNKRWLWIQIH